MTGLLSCTEAPELGAYMTPSQQAAGSLGVLKWVSCLGTHRSLLLQRMSTPMSELQGMGEETLRVSDAERCLCDFIPEASGW